MDNQTALKFTSEELADDPQYRKVSLAAIAALVAGLLTPVAVFSTVLWSVPLLAILISFGALRRIAARPDQLSGAHLAWTGMGLSLAVLGFVTTRQATRQHQLSDLARGFADEFLVTIEQGRFRDAYLMHVLPGDRAEVLRGLQEPHHSHAGHNHTENSPPSLMELEEDPRSVEARFLDSELIREFRNPLAKADPRLEFLDVEKVVPLPPFEEAVYVRYRAHFPGENQPKVYRLQLNRYLDPQAAVGEWRVEQIQQLAEAAGLQ